MNLFEIGKKQSLQKTVRVLVYPNITFQKDIEKDSYIQVITNQIKILNEIRNDLWFYLILPSPVSSLNFDNVTQWFVDLPTYPQTMRSHFDVFKIQKMLNSEYDFDVVMSHLPEHTHALKNVLYNVTHHIPPVFGYCHWFDLKDVVAWPKDSFIQNITGLLEYERCYLNTEYQKNLVLNQAKETFNDKTIRRLNDILTVQHLGVEPDDITNDINPNPKKIIVFNHRPDAYKHFNNFIKIMDDLWKDRQDFLVWIPLLTEKLNKSYITNDKGNKEWYYNKLKECCVGFSPKQKYGGWSVATTDGMMNGVPYIMYNEDYYKELYNDADFFSTDTQAVSLLNKYLNNTEYRNDQATKSLNHIKKNLVYKNKIVEMNDYMNELLSSQKEIKDSQKLYEIIDWIKTSKSVSKSEILDNLNWGRGIKWTPYRRALMKHPNIYDVNSEEPTYKWKE
jgi:glycosyltransferase involved in cell wall biosynthesis